MKKLLVAALVVACGSAFGAWTIDTGAKTLSDGNWTFSCTFGGTDSKDITLTALTAGSGDLDLSGLPDDYKVVAVANDLFKNKTLTSFTEPNELKTIGQYSFYTSSLTNFTGGAAVTSTAKGSFQASKIKTIAFPSLTATSQDCFYNCSELESISFPNATTIGTYSFNTCKKLANLGDVTKWTTIGYGSFAYCALGPTLTFPNVTTIDQQAFYHVKNLTEVHAPKVTSIGNSAFHDTQMQRAYFPKVASFGGANSLNECDLMYIELGPVTACQGGLFNQYSCHDACEFHFFDTAVPTFGTNAYPGSRPNGYRTNPPTPAVMYRFYVHRQAALSAWTDACFAKVCDPSYSTYWESAPKRTIGIMRANGKTEGTEPGWAYVIDATVGLLITVQ